MHEACGQRIARIITWRDFRARNSNAYLAQQLKAAGVTQPLFDDTGPKVSTGPRAFPPKVNNLATPGRASGGRGQAPLVDEASCWMPPAEALL